MFLERFKEVENFTITKLPLGGSKITITKLPLGGSKIFIFNVDFNHRTNLNSLDFHKTKNNC